MMKIFLLITLAVISLADPVHYDKITDEINKTIDEAIVEFEKSETLDPMKVPEHSEQFERHIGILDIKGELLIKNIEIRGLKKLHRQGDAQVKSEDGVVKAKILLASHDDIISVESDVSYHIAELHPAVHVISDIADFAVEVQLDISEEGNITMTSFEVRQFANVVNHITGLSVLNPIFAVLSDVITFIFNGYIRDEMTQVLAPAFKQELEKRHEFYLY